MSKAQSILTKDQKNDILLDDIDLKTLNQFACLGFIIHPGILSQTNVEKGIGEDKKGIEIANSVLWTCNTPSKTKCLIYDTIVQSVLLYGAVQWTLNMRLKFKLTLPRGTSFDEQQECPG